MTTSPPAPRRFKLGTRELVIAFAIVEAIAMLWLVTHSRARRRAPLPPMAPARAESLPHAPTRP